MVINSNRHQQKNQQYFNNLYRHTGCLNFVYKSQRDWFKKQKNNNDKLSIVTFYISKLRGSQQAKGFWTYRIEISDGLNLLVVICPGQLSKAFWVKLAAVGEELGAVLLGQLRAERVDGDDEGSPVCLELQQRREGQRSNK